MLPPKVVPGEKSVVEYQRLLIRNQSLTWLAQMSQVSKIILQMSPEDAMSESDRRKMLALMTAVQASVFVTDTITGVQDTAADVVKFAASEGGKLLDKNELTKKAKDKAASAFGFVSQLANDAVHKVLEDVVLPHVGLPVHYVPEGGTGEQYLTMALRFEKIGYVEPMRAALNKATSAGSGDRARVLLATRVCRTVVRPESMSKFVDALKFIYTKKESQGKELLLELLRDEPGFDWIYPRLAFMELVSGNEERARDLLARVLRQNPDFLPGWSMLATVELAAWQIEKMEKHLERMVKLDPLAEEVAKTNQMLSLINQGGLR